MNLSEQLNADLREAMKAGDNRRRDVIRYLRAAISNASIEKRSELSDGEILDLIRYQIKQRRDSIELFRAGGRDELADEEQAQIEILLPYLPAQLDRDELVEIVYRVASEVHATGPRDMAKLMPALIAETRGRAEGRVLSQLASQELARRASIADSET